MSVRQQRLKPNDRGYPWNKQVTCYHATIAARRIMSDGFKTRRQLDKRVNATGGGTDAAVSLTLDLNVARAIVLGLRVGRRLARREITFGELILQGSVCAPRAHAHVIHDERLTADAIVRIDEGLVPFYWGMGGSSRGYQLTREQLDTLLATNDAEYVDEKKHVGAGKPYFVSGWAPFETMVELTATSESWARVTWDRLLWKFHWEYYKRLLAWGDMGVTEDVHEVYDPLFFGTDLMDLGEVAEDDIAILKMTVDADWLVAAPNEIAAMGYDARFTGPHAYDWAETSQAQMERIARGDDDVSDRGKYGRPAEWEPAHPSDTVAYLGAHMAEVRVYDPRLLKNVRWGEELPETMQEIGSKWDRKLPETDEPGRQMAVDAPIAVPWFKPKTPWIRPHETSPRLAMNCGCEHPASSEREPYSVSTSDVENDVEPNEPPRIRLARELARVMMSFEIAEAFARETANNAATGIDEGGVAVGLREGIEHRLKNPNRPEGRYPRLKPIQVDAIVDAAENDPAVQAAYDAVMESEDYR